MPSFAFWKKFKSETKSSVLSDAAVAEELRAIIPPTPGKVELSFEDNDSGIFLFDDDAEEFSMSLLIDHASVPCTQTPYTDSETRYSLPEEETESVALQNKRPNVQPSLDTTWPSRLAMIIPPTEPTLDGNEIAAHQSPHSPSTFPGSTSAAVSIPKPSVHDCDKNRDSGIYMYDTTASESISRSP